MEESLKEGKMKQVSRRKSKKSKNQLVYVHSEMDEPIKPSAYDGEIREIEEEEEEEWNLLTAK